MFHHLTFMSLRAFFTKQSHASRRLLRAKIKSTLAMTSLILNLLFYIFGSRHYLALQHRQADIRQRTGAATFERFDARGVASAEIVVHFIRHIFHKSSQISS